MSGVIVIANRATAARDILSGTIHKLTLWLDDVRRKPVIKLLLGQLRVDGMAVRSCTPADEEGLPISPDGCISTQSNARKEPNRKRTICFGHQLQLRRSHER